MLKGRLGLETARIPHIDRDGLLWLSRGKLAVEAGCLYFETSGSNDLEAGAYAIPFQTLSFIIIGPGSSVTHDALRLMARHGTGLVVSGEEGVRFYASMPFGPDSSTLARKHAALWSNPIKKINVARKMYAWRMGEIFPNADLNVLRGIEGSRAKKMYEIVAQKYDIQWKKRSYNRQNPSSNDDINQAINHAASAVEAAAMIAVACTGTIPQLGFIHEGAGHSFVLDVADLFRDSITLPIAFSAVKALQDQTVGNLEHTVRSHARYTFVKEKVISTMINKIKEIFNDDDCNSHTQCD